MDKFLIIDPSLRDERGHHFDLSLRIAQLAKAMGCEVHILCHSQFAGQFNGVDIAIHPVFAFNNYDYADDEEHIRQTFATMLQQKLLELGVGLEDVILCHTSDARIYDCALRYFVMHGETALPLHLATPYDEAVMPGNTPKAPVAGTIQKLCDIASEQVFLWAETVPLANHLSARWNVRVEPLLLPAKQNNGPTPQRIGGAFTLAYLGAAREEKGFHLLPDLVEGVLRDKRCDRIEFFIQCSPQIAGYAPSIRAAIERLQTLSSDRIKLHAETLSSKDYDEVFSSAYGLLLPYELEKYRTRGSGIAWDGATCGKVLVTRTGTMAASFTTNTGSIVAKDIESWIEGIADYCSSPENYHNAASDRAEYLRGLSTPEMYISRIRTRSSRERMASQSPGAILGKPMPLLARKIPETY